VFLQTCFLISTPYTHAALDRSLFVFGSVGLKTQCFRSVLKLIGKMLLLMRKAFSAKRFSSTCHCTGISSQPPANQLNMVLLSKRTCCFIISILVEEHLFVKNLNAWIKIFYDTKQSSSNCNIRGRH
jgi:hypothetical protein